MRPENLARPPRLVEDFTHLSHVAERDVSRFGSVVRGPTVGVRVRRPRIELRLLGDDLAQEVLRRRVARVAEGSGVAGDHDRVRIDAVDSAGEGIHERAVTRWRHELAVLELGREEPGQVRLVPDFVIVDVALVSLRQSDGEVVEFRCADLVHTVVTVPLHPPARGPVGRLEDGQDRLEVVRNRSVHEGVRDGPVVAHVRVARVCGLMARGDIAPVDERLGQIGACGTCLLQRIRPLGRIGEGEQVINPGLDRCR